MKWTIVLGLCCVLFSNLKISAHVRGITAAYLIPKGSILLLFCFFFFFLLCNAQYYCLNKQDLGVSNSSRFWPPSFVLVFSWNGEFGAEHERVWRSLRCRESSWLLDASRKDVFEKCSPDPPLTQRQAHSSLFPTRANQTFMSRECVFSGLDPKQCCSRVLEWLI